MVIFLMVQKEGDYFSYNNRGSGGMSVSTMIFISLGAFVLGLVIAWLFFPDFGDIIEKEEQKSILTCGDGTFNGTCSLNKPYFCKKGKIMEGAELCGCPEFMERENGGCTSDYQTNPKNVTLEYVLRGEKKNFSLMVYEGVADYLNKQDKNIFYTEGEMISRRDFKINAIEDKIQKHYISPLVKKIQNTAPKSKVEQARIAVSLVQNIPYGSSDQTVSLGEAGETNYSRFPYEVLYEDEGVCGEKVELMALLLREIGYGTSFFFWPMENHEALGIKCPVDESFRSTGYCFVETTMPAIISDSELEYRGVGKLSDNVETYLLSEGFSLPKDIYEYGDAEKLQREKESGVIGKGNYEDLREKYGLKGEYRVA